ncbi:hypothetical protein AVEN_26799-1 [Araneus ventricosus]|uniref:Uncharacterized protein n=1 Tax=Araneus ventricosus TaxID=182803 RepID=A0A4Y2VA84_ARAVE|nr:hypothetical protein AVEN_176788-1 [Araneus ventricosus]GBO21226.1 hypothetical protein AVEN_26799-1 [Araneus ventricosus]
MSLSAGFFSSFQLAVAPRSILENEWFLIIRRNSFHNCTAISRSKRNTRDDYSKLAVAPRSILKMKGSQVFDENHSTTALQFHEVNGIETVQKSKPHSTSKEEDYYSEDSSYFDDFQSGGA